MSDLLNRLRESSRIDRQWPRKLFEDAADEIERLRTENKRLSEIYAAGYIDGVEEVRQNNVDEIERLRAENERLRGVLAKIEENEHQFSMTWAADTARAALAEQGEK